MIVLSVIIPTKDRPAFIVDAVQSVLESVFQDFEIVVVDQSKEDDTERALVPFRADPRFHYHRNRTHLGGAARSRNLGIALSAAELLVMTDDDITVRPDWLEKIAAEFAADPALQFVCGKLAAPPADGRDGFTPTFDAGPGLSATQLPIAAAGANFSMRRSLLEQVGGYDEIWGPGSNLGFSDDGDLAWRIVRSGAKWRVCPHIEVIHTHGFRPSSAAAQLLKQYQLGIGANFARFTRRGDLFAMACFWGWQCRDLVLGVGKLACGRRSNGLGWVRDRLVGYCRAFPLPPYQGFITGPQLAQMHREMRLGNVVQSQELSLGL